MRLRVAQFLLAVAALAAILSGWAFSTGGFRVHMFGVPLSVRGADRAALVALALGAIGFFLHTRLRQRVSALAERLPPAPVLVLSAVTIAAGIVLWIGIARGSRAVGGADPYGYLSQSVLWLEGNLRIHQPFVEFVPWPLGGWTFSPLGYTPSDNYTIVPTYSPGYPLLMALFTIVFGPNGAYFVSPVCGAALVLLTYALGVRLAGPFVGASAALCIACSPTVLFFTLSTMSDIPVAAFWAAAVLMAARRTAPAAFLSAIAAGIAILIRPNLVFAAAIPLVIVAWPFPERSFPATLRRAVTFGFGCAPFAIFIAWLFNDLYGSPLRSGYGANEELFKLEHVGPNLRLYPRWLLETQGPLVFLFLAGPFVVARKGIRSSLRWLFAAFVAVIVVPYLLYYPFEDWWYLRFLLPAFPFVFILGADAVWAVSERFGRDARNLAVALFTLVMVFFGGSYTWQRDVLAVGRGEQKYADVGWYLNQVLPKNAVVYSLQHSGNIRHYTGRLTLRYDLLERNWLDESVEYLERQGYEVFIVMDHWEVPRFAERFASQQLAAVVGEKPRDAPCTHNTFFYRVRKRPGLPSAVRIPNPLDCK